MMARMIRHFKYRDLKYGCAHSRKMAIHNLHYLLQDPALYNGSSNATNGTYVILFNAAGHYARQGIEFDEK
eukprot:gene19801-6944_t